jgi:hypothetical protein
MSARGITNWRGAADELDDFSASLLAGTSLAEDLESVFALLGDLLESVLVVSDLKEGEGTLDDGSGDDGNGAEGLLPVAGSGSIDFGAANPELDFPGPVEAGAVEAGAVEAGAVEPGNAELGVLGELAAGGFNEGAVELGVAGAWPIASAAIATSVRSMNVNRILRVTAFVSSVVFRRRCGSKARLFQWLSISIRYMCSGHAPRNFARRAQPTLCDFDYRPNQAASTHSQASCSLAQSQGARPQ